MSADEFFEERRGFPASHSEAQVVLSVGQLTSIIKEVLEGTFPDVWVTGEISNLSRPQSGHAYFTLKDDQAQLRAVVWRTAAARLRFNLEDGLEVVCRGGLDLYPPRGSYQLVVSEMQPRGMGALELALRQLRAKLAAEGLFDAARKRPLHPFPKRVAVITSPTGAAVRDFLQVLARRWRGTDILVVPVRVQGQGAAAEIAAALELVNRLAAPVDTIVVARGGGSLEDLWAFNEEIVVRAIHASRIPVVSAIGHEIDVTLSDLVADLRALTPSEAAERVAPAAAALEMSVAQLGKRLTAALRNRTAAARARIESLQNRRVLRRPFDRLQQAGQRLDELSLAGERAVRRVIESHQQSLARQAAKLDSLSPLAVLGRGYSLTEHEGRLVRDAAELGAGDRLTTRLARGQVESRVESTSQPEV